MRTSKRKMDLATIFLLISVFVSPLRCYGFIIGGFNFSLFRIFGLLMIGAFIFSRKMIMDNVSKILIAIILITIFQVVYSPYISGSYSNFYSIVFGFVWIFFAYQILIKYKLYSEINKTILLSAIFPLGLGIYQWLIYRSTGSIPSLPFSFMVSSEGKTGLTYNVYARITSCFGDPAYMTTYFVGVFSVAFQSLIGMINEKRKRPSLFLVSIISLIILETVMSISLSGIIGLFASFILIILLNMKNNKNMKRLLLFGSIGAIAFVLYFANSGYELIEILLFKSNSNSQTSATLFGRSEYIFNALSIWLNNPLFGAGFGALRLNGSFSSAHSSLLTVLGQQGLIVFVLHLVLLIFIPINSYDKIKKQKDVFAEELYKGLLVSLFALLVMTLGYDTLYSLDFCYVIICLTLAFGKNGGRSDEQSVCRNVNIQRREVY